MTKIFIALSRGRHNIVFLIILTLLFVLWASSTWLRKRTGAGDKLLRRARLRFKRLQERADKDSLITGPAVFLIDVVQGQAGYACLQEGCMVAAFVGHLGKGESRFG